MRQKPWPWVVLVALGGAAVIGGLTATHSQGPDRPRPGGSDVSAFGARGDGETDDTPAIQRAVDSGAGTILFPKGIYQLTRPVVIDPDRVGSAALVGDGTARVVMAGAGAGVQVRRHPRRLRGPGDRPRERLAKPACGTPRPACLARTAAC